MLKIRYFRLRVKAGTTFEKLARAARKTYGGALTLVQASSQELSLVLTSQRLLTTVQYLDDGTSAVGSAATMERHSLRIFRQGEDLFLCVLDPPRGTRHVVETLNALVESGEYFFEPLELTTELIKRHLTAFQASKLVSAKVRDFQIFEKAVARLEVTSREGLSEEIAPILQNKFYRIDLLTYEVVHGFRKGLISYAYNPDNSSTFLAGQVVTQSPVGQSR